MAILSTLEALTTLSTSIPEWNLRLDELNNQIAQRQEELAKVARLTESKTKSIRNKGSTESLRPQDENEEHTNGHANTDDSNFHPYHTPPKSSQNGHPTLKRATSSAARAAAVVTPPLSKDSPDPRPSPTALARQSSQPTRPTQARLGLRKRKTDSVASAESQAPKYRTRSMIIVYYDSAVQTAFEELVKFVSGSRNSMRKGKMNAKMAAMRRAAEREVDDENTDDDLLNAMLTTSGSTLNAQKNVTVDKEGRSHPPGTPTVGDVEADDLDTELPKLKFVSTRNMGPPRGLISNPGSRLSIGILSGHGRAKSVTLGTKDIFDELDKALEWCQGQCERAAHQFLRDGDCSDEIEGIKKKLLEVKQSAEKEMEVLQKEEAENPKTPEKEELTVPPRQLRSIQKRRNFGTLKDLEVDKMEVDGDDNGAEIDLPPKLVFKRTRDYGRDCTF